MDDITLGRRKITRDSMPYVIAEIGVNHEGSLASAKELVAAACEAGADAAKFQSYKADLLAMRHSPAYWDLKSEPTQSQYELFSRFDGLGPSDYQALADYCSELGIDFISTPFDLAAVDMLDGLVPFYKIASADITNMALVRRVGQRGKPVVLSTGASNLDEIQRAVHWLHAEGCMEVVLLHCVLHYPTSSRDAHLRMIVGLQNEFPDLLVGYSDHTVPGLGTPTLALAYALGAVVLEKHFTLDKSQLGNDHYHAMDREDLKAAISQIAAARELLGTEHVKAALDTETVARLNARRCLVAARDLQAGERLNGSDLIAKRPVAGVGAEHFDEVIGRTLAHPLAEDEALQEWHLQP